ncbi:serine hydrolase domain-containing protein [Kordiimonas sp.]|uniref:serine hydrolase domain-containing protein n=1 Tax=Kordiimonas sp. TaxID=1970157 RepID=UPI003A93B2C6
MLNTFKYKAFSLLACLCLTSTGVAADALSEAWRAFEGRFDGMMQEAGTVGATVGFFKDDKIIARHSYGMADGETGRLIDDNTIFHWASITKTLTATAVMQLRDRGRLSLDEPIIKYLPEVRAVHNPYGSMEDITLRHLITHSSGFRSPTFPWSDGEDWQPFEPTAWSQVAAMMPYTRLHFPPGSAYSYSNPGISMLGRVVEIVSGDTIEEYLTKNILMQLGMSQSYFDTTPYHLLKDRSNSYWREDGKTKTFGLDFDTGATVGNGGLNAPVGDMVKWLNVWLGLDDSTPAILSRESFEEMWQALRRTDDSSVEEYMGMVFFTIQNTPEGKAAPTRYIGHTGDQAGFTAFVYIDPEAGTAAIYNNNTAGDHAFRLREQVRADMFENIFPAAHTGATEE